MRGRPSPFMILIAAGGRTLRGFLSLGMGIPTAQTCSTAARPLPCPPPYAAPPPPPRPAPPRPPVRLERPALSRVLHREIVRLPPLPRWPAEYRVSVRQFASKSYSLRTA